MSLSREKVDTQVHGRIPHEDRGRIGVLCLQIKMITKIASNHHMLGEKHGIYPSSEPPGRTNYADIWISDFYHCYTEFYYINMS